MVPKKDALGGERDLDGESRGQVNPDQPLSIKKMVKL